MPYKPIETVQFSLNCLQIDLVRVNRNVQVFLLVPEKGNPTYLNN